MEKQNTMKRVSNIDNSQCIYIRRLRVGLSLACMLLFALLMLLGACSQTEVEERPITGGEGKEVDATFRMNVLSNNFPSTRSLMFTDKETKEVADTLSAPSTRATNALDKSVEDNVANLWIAQYDDTGKLYSQYFESGAITSAATGLEVNLKLKTSAACRIYFIANAGDLESFITGESVLKTYTKDFAVSADGLPSGSLGMTGVWSGAVTDAGITGSVDLVRQAAKIIFKYTISNANGFSFTPTAVTLNNVPAKSQLIEPDAQLSSVSYGTYTGTVDNTTATVYWYLPENKAGIVSDANAVTSEKEKVGTGVSDATYIEMTGTAVQNGVTYNDVSVKLYPGGDAAHTTGTYNNYNVSRNCAYNMTITLTGIDFADKRVTVGSIPEITNPDNLDAAKGATKEVQITARPGVEWSFMLPSWLSAVIGGTSAGAGAQITYNGPAKITFTSVSANPTAEERTETLSIAGKNVTIKQNGSELKVNNPGQMDAAANSVSTNGWVNATNGLALLATISSADWLSFASPLATEATGANQDLTFKATTSNPSKNARSATVVVKGGNSISNGSYLALSKNVTVTQAGSTVTGSTVEVAATPVSNATATFGATPGLAWTATTGTAWITVGTTSGSNTAASNSVTYNTTATNPSSAKRAGIITVTAGGQSDSPTGTITVSQAASSLTVSANTNPLAATSGASGTYTLNGTSGLSFSVTNAASAWLTLTGTTTGTTNGSNQTFTYKTASVNPNSAERSGDVTVTAGNMSEKVTIRQSGSTFSVSNTSVNIAATVTSGSVNVTGTSGLPWTATRASGSTDISAGTTSSTATGSAQTLTFNTSVNTGGERSAVFTIAVTGGNHSKTVTVKQAAGMTGTLITIDNTHYAAYKSAANVTSYPPFDYDGNADYKGHKTTVEAGGSYSIELQKEDPSGQPSNDYYTSYNSGTGTLGQTAQNYCANYRKTNGETWRIPTEYELYYMYKIQAAGQNSFTPFASKRYYWSSSVYNGNSGIRCILNFSNGNINSNYTSYNYIYVRCVRDI